MDNLNNLSLKEKAQLIKSEGTFIASIDHYSAKADLYFMNNAFIKIQQHAETKEIECITQLSGKGLDRYINQVELPKY